MPNNNYYSFFKVVNGISAILRLFSLAYFTALDKLNPNDLGSSYGLGEVAKTPTLSI